MRIHLFAVLCLSLVSAAGCAAQAASPPPGLAEVAAGEVQPYTFRLVIGEDTIASDIVRRTPTRVEVELTSVTAGLRSDLAITVGPGEEVTRVTQRSVSLAAPDTASAYTLVAEFVGDSVRAERVVPGRGAQRAAFPTRPGAVAYLETSSATVEQVLRRARALGGETATVPVWDMGTARTAPAVVRWVGADSAVVTYGELEVHARVAGDGSLLEYRVAALGAHAIRIEGAHPLVRR